MADPNLEEVPDFRNPAFAVIRQGLQLGHNEDEDQVVERLIAAWAADRENRIAAWDAQIEEEARLAAEAEEERRIIREQEEQAAADEVERARVEVERKKPKMNSFAPGSAAPDVLSLPPSQYAIQKLSTFDYVELWYFTLAGCQDAARYHNRSQVDDTFGISKVDDHLTVRSIASVRASKNALPDHELSFSDFVQAKNCFLEQATKAKWPKGNLDTLAKFFWYLEAYPNIQLPLGEKVVLTYASRVRQDWHRELKADNGYDLSVINQNLMSSIADEVRALNDQQVKTQVSYYPPPPHEPRTDPASPPTRRSVSWALWRPHPCTSALPVQLCSLPPPLSAHPRSPATAPLPPCAPAIFRNRTNSPLHPALPRSTRNRAVPFAPPSPQMLDFLHRGEASSRYSHQGDSGRFGRIGQGRNPRSLSPGPSQSSRPAARERSPIGTTQSPCSHIFTM